MLGASRLEMGGWAQSSAGGWRELGRFGKFGVGGKDNWMDVALGGCAWEQIVWAQSR